ncbi:hypothetical protein M1E08_09890 [Erwinia sp. PK3-005]
MKWFGIRRIAFYLLFALQERTPLSLTLFILFLAHKRLPPLTIRRPAPFNKLSLLIFMV